MQVASTYRYPLQLQTSYVIESTSPDLQQIDTYLAAPSPKGKGGGEEERGKKVRERA